jgi:hypothetical protein
MEIPRRVRWTFAPVTLVAALLVGASGALLGTCGPFTDVAADSFCPFVLEIFALGITTGTTPTTFDPSGNVSRLQMAAFLSRTVDGVVKRGGNRRGIAEKFWTPQNETILALTTVGSLPVVAKFDGADLWVSNLSSGSVSRVRASDGRLLETWTGAGSAEGIVLALGRVLVTGNQNPGKLYMIDPRLPAGAVTTVSTALGAGARGIAFDGTHVWTANGQGGSVSIVTPGASTPWTAATVLSGFTHPTGILYDGSNVWVTDPNVGTLLKLDAAGAILQTVTCGISPAFPVFDGTNIWVPNATSGSVTVVRASTGAVLQTLTGNGLDNAFASSFDGERILVSNFNQASVSLFKAASLAPLGVFSVGAGSGPGSAASDGASFWIPLGNASKIARF